MHSKLIDALTVSGVKRLCLKEFKVPKKTNVTCWTGRYSVVIDAWHGLLGRVAVKILHPQEITAEKFEEEISTQFEASKRENVLSIEGFICERFQSVEVFGIVTKFMVCGTLHDFIHDYKELSQPLIYDWPLTSYQILYEMVLTLDGLHKYSDRERLLHFDLKPQNILLDDYLHPMIGDFGAARFATVSGSNSAPLDHNTVHTFRYASPEFLQSNKRGSKYDVYCFGIMMWEMLSKTHPYEDTTKPEAYRLIMAGNHPSSDQIITDENAPHITAALKNLYERCCSFDPKSRPSFSEITGILTPLIDEYTEDRIEEAKSNAKECIWKKLDTTRFKTDQRDYQQPMLKSPAFQGILKDWSKADQRDNEPKLSVSLVFGIVMALIGTSLQCGFNLAIVNGPANEIKDFFFGSTKACTNTVNISDETSELKSPCASEGSQLHRDAMWAVAVSILTIGRMIGYFLILPLLENVDSFSSMMLVHLISLASAAFLGLAKSSDSFAMIVVGRVMIGMFTGLATDTVLTYIRKTTPKRWFRYIWNIHQLLVAVGILVAQVLSLQTVLGTDELWPLLLALTCVPSILAIACVSCLPEPSDHTEEGATYDTDIYAMKMELPDQSGEVQLSVLQLLRERSIRPQLITVLLLMTAQQFSGITAVFSYTNTIYDIAGIQNGNPQNFASIAIGAAYVFMMMVISTGIFNSARHKMLLLGGFAVMIFGGVAATIILNLFTSDDKDISTWIIVCVIAYVVGYSIGPGQVTWHIAIALFPQAARRSGFLTAHLLNWTCAFMVDISFPSLANAAGPKVFLIFTAVSTLIAVLLVAVLPETKDKTPQEIKQFYAAGSQALRGTDQRVPSVHYRKNASRTNITVGEGTNLIKNVIREI